MMSENSYLLFLTEYARNFREIGAIAPDSSACVKGLLKSVPFETAELILEYGAASGAVTKEILRRKSRNSTLICFEKNRLFYNRLGKTLRGKDAIILNDDVYNAANAIAPRFNIKNRGVDCIVSTLPCSTIEFDRLIQDSVLPLLGKDGVFIQYMHTASVLKGFRLRPILRRYFTHVDSGFVLLNLPPVVIYTCRGRRALALKHRRS